MTAWTCLAAVTIPFFGGLLGFFGGLVFAPTSYFVPCVMWLIAKKPKPFSFHWIMSWPTGYFVSVPRANQKSGNKGRKGVLKINQPTSKDTGETNLPARILGNPLDYNDIFCVDIREKMKSKIK
ncbi:hypothetical protein H6P81_001513 [Aristolochia fimbriata]|uniref:Amino acid transporter transmembrane domain-containing protein n=1 Tax=Aristolochia fimbriata TaxID=158543 RepID=A0AAV7F737_ARIFI|nr:hypothetical protein H6P81_001513 [Aristolochia fimbriata]